MRNLLTALFLCFAILVGIVENASGASTVHGLKIASGDFWENPNICTYKLGSLELEPCRGDTIVGYDSATDVLYYVRQNPWSSFDPHGLRRSLTFEEQDNIDETNRHAEDIIKQYGNEGEEITTPELLRKEGLFEKDGPSNGFNKLTKTGRLRREHSDLFDEDIAIVESARRNAMRAKHLLARNGKLSRKEVNKLSLYAMLPMAVTSGELLAMFAPYSRIAQLAKPAATTTRVGGTVTNPILTRNNDHHSIPQYFGGRKAQDLAPLNEHVHKAYHEFLDNWQLPSHIKPRHGWSEMFRGPTRPFGRENAAGLKAFASESIENRQWLVDQLRTSMHEFGIYRQTRRVFESEANHFINSFGQ